ncbi:MAG: hypothetical protein CBHOC_4683 [uncultured Caballeronia sp.]|nr:MAG: hypothetical protein CBHOC_4683 [uncultured Caballeronia sp.]
MYAVLEGKAPNERGHDLKVAVLGGFFEAYASREAWDAVMQTASLFGPHETIDMPEHEMQLARGAATIISNVEVASAHANLLDAPADDVSPRLRTRLLAGALSPAAWYAPALCYQQRFRTRMARMFANFDILLAPCTPFSAPRFSDTTIVVGDHALEPAKHLGMLTQPISFAGFPVVTASVMRKGRMPLGVQLIGTRPSTKPRASRRRGASRKASGTSNEHRFRHEQETPRLPDRHRVR